MGVGSATRAPSRPGTGGHSRAGALWRFLSLRSSVRSPFKVRRAGSRCRPRPPLPRGAGRRTPRYRFDAEAAARRSGGSLSPGTRGRSLARGPPYGWYSRKAQDRALVVTTRSPRRVPMQTAAPGRARAVPEVRPLQEPAARLADARFAWLAAIRALLRTGGFSAPPHPPAIAAELHLVVGKSAGSGTPLHQIARGNCAIAARILAARHAL